MPRHLWESRKVSNDMAAALMYVFNKALDKFDEDERREAIDRLLKPKE